MPFRRRASAASGKKSSRPPRGVHPAGPVPDGGHGPPLGPAPPDPHVPCLRARPGEHRRDHPEDELIVGCRTSKLKGAPLFPENKSRWIAGDLENFDRRVLQRALITQRRSGSSGRTSCPSGRGGPRRSASRPSCRKTWRGHGQVHLHDDAGDHVRHRPLHHEPSPDPPAGTGGRDRGHRRRQGGLSKAEREGRRGSSTRR
jgi:hypothetical protein